MLSFAIFYCPLNASNFTTGQPKGKRLKDKNAPEQPFPQPLSWSSWLFEPHFPRSPSMMLEPLPAIIGRSGIILL
jgi:hypothetical protein